MGKAFQRGGPQRAAEGGRGRGEKFRSQGKNFTTESHGRATEGERERMVKGRGGGEESRSRGVRKSGSQEVRKRGGVGRGGRMGLWVISKFCVCSIR
jgi:hypothetical protein